MIMTVKFSILITFNNFKFSNTYFFFFKYYLINLIYHLFHDHYINNIIFKLFILPIAIKATTACHISLKLVVKTINGVAMPERICISSL